MSGLINRKFKCTGCGEARPCYLETNQSKDEIAFYDATEDLRCVLDKANQTAYNWIEVLANEANKQHDTKALDLLGVVPCYWCEKKIKAGDILEMLPDNRGIAHEHCAEEFYGSQMAKSK